MSLLPVRARRLSEVGFHKAFHVYIAEHLVEFVTAPGFSSRHSSDDIVKRFEEEGVLPDDSEDLHSWFIRMCQEIRLNPDEIEILLYSYFA